MLSHGERGLSRAHRERRSPDPEDKLGWIEASVGGNAEAIQVEAGRAGLMEGQRLPIYSRSGSNRAVMRLAIRS